jgi:parvulin-like peptidyl-prolyl isomerase
MGKESKIRKLRKEGVIAPVNKEHGIAKWVKILILVILIFALTLTGLGIWGYVERDVAAKVGKETIKKTDIQSQLDYYTQLYQQFGMDLNDPQYASTKKNVEDSILDGLVSESLLVQYAKEHNLKIDQDQYNKNMDEQIKSIIDKGIQDNGEQQFNDLVNARFGSMDAYKDYLKKVLQPYVERPLYQQAALDEQYKTIKITDDDVKNYWDSIWEVDAEHLLIEVSANATSKEKGDAKKLAEDIYKSILDEQGKQKESFNFADFTKKKAEDLNKEQATTGKEVAKYEALGYFAKGQMVKPFEDACFDPKVKVQDILGPVETDFGYHIIHILGEKYTNEKYDEPAKANVRLVLFKYTAGDQKSEDNAKMSANSIAIQTKNGMSFVDAVKRFSEDETTKAKDGETGLFSQDDKPELFAAAQNLSVGGIAGPIKTTDGYAVIQLIENKPVVKATLSDKATFDKVKTDLETEKKQEIETNFVDGLKKQYGVRTTNPWRSLTAFISNRFGNQINSFVTWWNKVTGKTTTTTTTPSDGTEIPSTPDQGGNTEPLPPVSGGS